MKKSFILLCIGFIIVLIILSVILTSIRSQNKEIAKYNSDYEFYKDKEALGTDVATIINKAINHNEKNKVAKDKDGNYDINNENCIQVEVRLLEEEKELISYRMEVISKVGIESFIQNFNIIKFKCKGIEYHKESLKVSKIIFEEISEN